MELLFSKIKKILFLSVFICYGQYAFAQFYNGYQQDFGKNRVQYDEKFWFYFRHETFDVYFDKGGRKIAEYVLHHVDSNYAEIKNFLEFNYARRFVFIVYNTLGDFRQSNIGLSTSTNDNNVGGTRQIIDNKVVLYFSGDHNDLNRQIKKGIADVMIQEFLYGASSSQRVISNPSTSSYPQWFVEGMSEYLSDSWSYENNVALLQLLKKRAHTKLSILYGNDATLLGHAFWNYLGEKYGTKVISNTLYISKITDDIDGAFRYVIGKDLQSLLSEMANYYRQSNPNIEPLEHTVSIPKRLTKRAMPAIELNFDASKLAYVTNKSGKTGIWIYDMETGENKKIFGFGSVIEQITDYSFPVIQWHPNLNVLTYIYEKKGQLWLAIYNNDENETTVRKFHHFDKVLDFSYSADGAKIVFSGVQEGQTDIFVYHMHTFENEQLTNDNADDRFPSFIQNDNAVIFSSNRSDTTTSKNNEKIQPTYDLFILKNSSLTQLHATASNNIKPLEYEQGMYVYLDKNDNKSGVFAIQTDSAVSYVDTAFHYSYFSNDFVYNDNKSNISSYDISNSTIVRLAPNKKKWSLHSNEIRKSDFVPTTIPTRKDSTDDATLYERESANLYKTNFYINNLVNQLEFNFINSGYQAFTGGEYDYTQNLNFLMKLGIIDLFEDYRLTGAYRFTGSLGTNEYLVSVENLRKRLDRQYIFHRQSGLTYGTNSLRYYQRIQDNNFLIRYKYPLNQVQSFSFNPSFRYVRNITLATDMTSLNEPTTNDFWIGLSCNHVFDNVRKRELNIYEGTRTKVFAEGFAQINKAESFLFVFGFDARHYQKLHKNLIIAARIAYSSSFGTAPLLYYLGAVDNWLNLFGKYATYNASIEYDHSVNWAYQAIGTDMRGFSQNIRNGNSFAVANLELRWPIIQYCFAKPLKSDILKNFQVIAFTDFGGAWSGLIPGQKSNAYNYTIIQQEPISVEIDEMRQPFVCSYGFGFRTRLLGYFMRLDIGWGYDEGMVQKMNQFSLGMDF